MNISVIVPFLNESQNLSVFCKEMENYLVNYPQLDVEVVFVDDGSSDDSISIIKNFPFKNYACKIIKLSRNVGSHAAVRAGMTKSNGDYTMFISSDMQDPLTLIHQLFEKINKGFDIAWASRAATKGNFFEKLFSKIYAMLMKKYVNPNFPQKGFDIVMFNEKIKNELLQNVESNSTVFLQILNLGFKQTFITYTKLARNAGKSKWTLSKKIKLLVDSFIGFSYAPIRLVTFIGIVFFFIGMIWSSYIVLRKIIYDDLASGWPALLSILLIGFGITNISLGIIAEYLWRTLDATRKRPVFIIDEIINLNRKNEK